jgi:protein SCO1/2
MEVLLALTVRNVARHAAWSLSFAAGALLLAVAVRASAGELPEPAVTLGAPFGLTDQHGVRRSERDLADRYVLISFGYTWCPDICPTTLSDLAQAQKQWAALPAAIRPRVLFVSVDPGRDTPEKTGTYAAYFHPETLAATVPEPALQAFASSLGLVYMKVATGPDDDYTRDHSTALVVLDPQGRQAGLIRPPFVPADIASDLATLTGVRP